MAVDWGSGDGVRLAVKYGEGGVAVVSIGADVVSCNGSDWIGDDDNGNE